MNGFELQFVIGLFGEMPVFQLSMPNQLFTTVPFFWKEKNINFICNILESFRINRAESSERYF